MKVYIGPYKQWFGPYQLAESLLFWIPKEKDEYGFEHVAKRVHNFGEWLAYGSVEPEPQVGDVSRFDRERTTTWLFKLLIWLDSKKQRKIKIHIDSWDTWGMDSTLGYIIRPMLADLKNSKHGTPYVADEDVPEHLRSTAATPLTEEEKDSCTPDSNHAKRWDWVLNEIIFAFDNLECGPNEDWEDQFTTGDYDFQSIKREDGMFEMTHGPKHTATTDWDARKVYAQRVTNGFCLFGKYYQSLWK